MKINFFWASLALLTAPVGAQTTVGNVGALQVAPKMATVTPFITGLKEPQGMVFDGNNNLLICDYGAGEILRFKSNGTPLGKLATELKGPAQIVFGNESVTQENVRSTPQTRPVFFVTERKANRVVRVDSEGKIAPLGGEIAEPLGLINGLDGLILVSHTTSKVYRWKQVPILNGLPLIGPLFGSRQGVPVNPSGRWELLYGAPSIEGARYGFRWLASDGGAYFLSDEVGECILMFTEGGRVATFASGISDPSGIVIGPDKMVYVANEGNGGQLLRLNAEGEKTVVAEKLGRPRGILFLDAKTALVSNRDGNVWKIAFP